MKKEKGSNGVFFHRLGSLPWPLLTIFLFLTFTIAVSGYFYYQKQKKDVIREQTTQLRAIADLKAPEISNWRRQKLNDGHLIFTNRIMVDQLLSFLRQPTAGAKNRLLKWLEIRRKDLRYTRIMLFDMAGKLRLTAGGGESRAGSEELKLMDESRRKREVLLSDLQQSKEISQIRLETVIPLLAAGPGAPASVGGFLILRSDPRIYLFPLIQSWPTPSPSAETLLVRREGDTVVYLNELRHRKNTAMKLRFSIHNKELPAAQAALGKTGVVSGRDYRGITVWAVIEPVPDSNWIIIAKVDREEIERPIRREAWGIFLVILSLVLAAAMVTLFLWQRQNTRFRRRQSESTDQRQALVQHFAYLIRYANDVILLSDDQGNILEANERAMTTYGYDREALLKMNLRDLRAPEERDKVTAAYRKSEDKSGLIFETVHLKKDGSVFPVEISARAITIDDKKQFQSIIRDISERKRAEAALSESGEKYRYMFANNPQPMWIYDLETLAFLEVNEAAIEHYGYSKEEFLSMTLKDIRPKEDIPALLKDVELTRKILNPAGEWRHVKKNGEIINVEIISHSISFNDRQARHVLVKDITERKRAETALHLAHERFRRFIDANIVGIIIADMAGKIVEANDYYLNLIGFTRDEFAEGLINWREITPREWLPADERAIRELKEKGTCLPYEKEYLRRDGTRVPVFLADAMLPGPGEQIAAFVLDLTDSKRAEEELRVSEERFRSTLDNMMEGCQIIDFDWRYLYVNKAITEHGQQMKDALLGHTMMEVYPGIEKTEMFAVLRRCMGERLPQQMENEFSYPDDAKKWFELSFQPVPEGVFILSIDISESKRAEAALRESEDKFRYVFDNSVLGKSITLPNGEISVNKAFCALLGYSPAEMKSRKWQELTYADDVKITQDALDAVLSGARDSARFEKRYIHKNGTLIWADVSTALRRDPEGKPLYFMTTVMDITASKRAEEEIRALNAGLEQRVLQRTAQLEAANKELEAFSYSVSHDLRAPLRAIEGFSRIMLEEYAATLDDEGRRLLDVISGNTRKMAQLIDDLLAFSRLSRQQMAHAPVDLAGLAAAAFVELKNLEKKRRIEFKTGALPPAFGDRSMLRLVLQNLLANAVKFTRLKPRARIEFGGRAAIGEAIYYVKDNGAGFDMEYVHKLFGVFQRLHGSDEFEGTGVGLAIVQRIVLRHGGRVWAESGKGGGATFYFALPAAAASETAAGGENPADNKATT